MTAKQEKTLKERLKDLSVQIGLWTTSSEAGISEEYIKEYDRKQSIVSVGKEEMAAIILDCIPVATKEPFSVLDIGSGTGYLTGVILNRFHEARVTCMDISKEMVEAAKVRLVDFADRITFVLGDFNSPAWRENLPQFRVIVALEALHRLHDSRTRHFYGEILQQLQQDGWFFSGCPFRSGSPFLEHLFDLGWAKYIQKRAKELQGRDVPLNLLLEFKRLGREARDTCQLTPFNRHSAREILEILFAVGFESADVIWRQFSATLIIGHKSRN